jgi:hypothetical protein
MELHDQVMISSEHLLAEARAAALGFGDTAAWIERVVVSTQPMIDPTALAVREDALGELHRMLGEAAADNDLLKELAHPQITLARHDLHTFNCRTASHRANTDPAPAAEQGPAA